MFSQMRIKNSKAERYKKPCLFVRKQSTHALEAPGVHFDTVKVLSARKNQMVPDEPHVF